MIHLAVISTLVMSTELAQSEEDAEDYDLEALERRVDPSHRDLSEAQEGQIRLGDGRHDLREDEVVFEIGDEENEDGARDSPEHHRLIGGSSPGPKERTD